MTVLAFTLLIFLTNSYGDKFNKESLKLDSVQYSMDATSLSYEFENKKENSGLELVPVTNIQAGISITKNNYSIGFSFEDPSQSDDIKELGRSRAFDAQFSSTYRRHYIEAYYQRYSGLGVQIGTESKPINYDYESLNYGVLVKHFFNEEYDPYNSLMHFSHEKFESSSWVLGFALERNLIKNNNGILPTEFNNLYSEYIDVRQLRQTAIGANFGYTRLHRFSENYYLNYLLAFGPNLINAEYIGGDIENTQKTGLASNLSIDFGYSFKKSLFGLSLNTTRSNLEASEFTSISYSRTKVQIYYNYFF